MDANKKLKRKLKGIFFLYRVHQIIPNSVFSFLANLSEVSKWINKHRAVYFNDFYNKRVDYKNREGLYEYIIKTQNLDDEIDYLEFGVSKGTSFKWWINAVTNEKARFYGFDTFSGLPEDWGPFKQGDMSNGNNPPVIRNDKRHTFYQGLFQQTLLPFLENYQSDKRKVIHLDADLFSATLYVLTLITPYLNKGDILLFDEFNVPNHEFKAFKMWTESFYIEYELIGAVNNYFQVAFLLK